MDLSLLATLKQKLQSAKSFSDVYTYFLDHFGEDPAFIALGDQAGGDPFLEAVFAEVGRQLFGGHAVTLSEIRWTRLPEHHFLHGGCQMNGKLATVLYFDDVHVGLLAILWCFSPAETKFVRFTGRPLPPVNREPSLN
jgi:hypothetical protein